MDEKGFAMKELIRELKIPEKSGKKIGLFRTVCATLGGLVITILSMALLITIISVKKEDMTLMSIILNGTVWALVGFWIALASSKYEALLRAFIPSVVLTLAFIIVYNF